MKRRSFLRTAASAALAATGSTIIIPVRAQPKTLKILTIRELVAGFDEWFSQHSENWAKQNNTEVILDFIGQDDLHFHADAEVAAQQGHDLVFIPWGVGVYEKHVIDHREIYEECERHYGKAHDLAIKSTFNPATGKFTAVASDFLAFPVNYRKDLWDAVTIFPDSWDDVRFGGRKIKFLHNHPVGISLAPAIDADVSLRAVLYSFGGSVQNIDGVPVLKSRATLEAIKFVKALFEEAMTEEVLTWDGVANNRFMLSGEGSLTLNAPNITRSGENKKMPVADQIWLAPPPGGPTHRLVPTPGLGTWIIWRFAANIDSAKQFLVDLIGQSRDITLKSGFFRLPCFPGTTPDMDQLLAHDSKATPSDKYKMLAQALDWTTNMGYPGYETPQISEILNIGLIPMMFAKAATGKMTPEEALSQADQEIRQIFNKWQSLGKA
jgi:multiple sugar transport system substrate-binding protein